MRREEGEGGCEESDEELRQLQRRIRRTARLRRRTKKSQSGATTFRWVAGGKRKHGPNNNKDTKP